MQFTQLLGMALKHDDMLEILEYYDMQVVYDFDRTHEGTDDLYWAASKDAGIEFRFNQAQILDVAFLYIAPCDGFEAIDQSLLDVAVHQTFEAAEQACLASHIPYQASPGEPGSPQYKWWIKLDHGRYTAHYQYQDGRLVRLTLALK